MVHPTRNCILTNRHILNLFISLALVVIYLFFSNYSFANAAAQQQHDSTASYQHHAAHDLFHEDLFIRPLSDGKLLAHFQFVTTYRKDIKSLRWENKVELLPVSIADLVTSASLKELHFSLTKGNWNYKNWGYPIRPSPAGAEIRASFSRHTSGKNLDDTWRRLTNSLAGRFCASLKSADEHVIIRPKLSFNENNQLEPHLATTNDSDNVKSTDSSQEHMLCANLPEETLCTGNLTPWKKLLPCYSNSGLASLLNSTNLFRSSHSSLSVDLESKQCLDESGAPIPNCERVQFKQSMTIVFNPLLQFEGKQTWSLAKIFGISLKKLCPVAEHSLIHVDITNPDDRTKLYPKQPAYQRYSVDVGNAQSARHYATYNLKELLNGDKVLNLGIKQTQPFKKSPFTSRKPVPVDLRTHVAGLGTYDGTIIATITNTLKEPIRTTYMDTVPHFMRLYLHTLHIRLTESGQELKPDQLNFELALDDKSPSLIEFSIVVPAQSEMQISYDFDRAFLRWTDFKPGANKGVLLSSAMISIQAQQHAEVREHMAIPLCAATRWDVRLVDDSNAFASNHTTSPPKRTPEFVPTRLDRGETVRVYARPLLFILPTPDFSMPYNVLCMVSTVLVFAFGPIYNITIRRPIIKRKKPTSEDAKKKSE